METGTATNNSTNSNKHLYKTPYGNYEIDKSGKVYIDYSTVINDEIGQLILHIKETFSQFHKIKHRCKTINNI